MSDSSLSKPNREAAERLADIFSQLQRSFVQRLSKELSRGKVSFPQYFLLSHLNQIDSSTMTEIARWMGHTTAAATGMVDRLEALGLAERTRPESDRRTIRVKITRKGAGLVVRVRADMVANIARFMEHLTAEERAAWLRIYEKILPLCV